MAPPTQPLRTIALDRVERDMPVTKGFAFEPALTVLKDYNKHLYADLL